MNSLNIISSRVSPPTTPGPSRSNSLGSLGLAVTSTSSPSSSSSVDEVGRKEGNSGSRIALEDEGTSAAEPEEQDHMLATTASAATATAAADESTPLLSHHDDDDDDESKTFGGAQPPPLLQQPSTWHLVPKRIASTFLNSIRWVLSTLAAPGVYLIACLYDENGNFAPFLQLRKLFGVYHGNTRKFAADYHEATASIMDEKMMASSAMPQHHHHHHHHTSAAGRPNIGGGAGASSSSGLSSESESDADRRGGGGGGGGGGGHTSSSSSRHHGRSKSLPDHEEIAPARRSIRIKLHSDESLRQRKHRKAQSASVKGSGGNGSGSSSSTGATTDAKDISAQLKSPTSPVGALTKYPKTPAPPRPLIPRRQPSYINVEPLDKTHQKTLILDLDETLIHSMSKGGRMSSGHMVEVRLNTTYLGVGGHSNIGPQHPILYYVHKRPHCDDFLRRVCKWYNLVIFTASVQEYADPVIDWLESERKFFSARYYRQHCTFRHGAFIKDLSAVEPDLSKVMILDNSPLSYMFHQDNAIPIQGWISDPTDNDLLHLVPLLEGLQYVSDVRAFLALRDGEDGQHMA